MELGLYVKREWTTASGGVVKLAQGSVVDFTGDALVNAANSLGHGMGSGGVDGAITRAGGEALLKARLDLPILDATTKLRIPPGDARTTSAFGSLRTKFVIHAVSANYNQARTQSEAKQLDDIVRQAYRRALEEAKAHECRTVAFSLLSAGIYRGRMTLEHVLGLGASVLVNEISSDQTVYLTAFSGEELATLEKVLPKCLPG